MPRVWGQTLSCFAILVLSVYFHEALCSKVCLVKSCMYVGCNKLALLGIACLLWIFQEKLWSVSHKKKTIATNILTAEDRDMCKKSHWAGLCTAKNNVSNLSIFWGLSAHFLQWFWNYSNLNHFIWPYTSPGHSTRLSHSYLLSHLAIAKGAAIMRLCHVGLSVCRLGNSRNFEHFSDTSQFFTQNNACTIPCKFGPVRSNVFNVQVPNFKLVFSILHWVS